MNIILTDTKPKYIQIFNYISMLINKNILKPNDKLPSKRNLALELNLSLNTIIQAYNLLLDEGYIYTIEKKGYFVCEQPSITLPITSLKNNEIIKNDLYYDLTTSNVEKFYNINFKKIAKEIIDSDTYLNKTNQTGDLNLKKAIKKHLFENRGIITNTQNIIIGSGIEMLEQILSLISINNITLENPGYHKLASIAQNINKTINYINLDDQGVKIPPKQTILYTTPFNQFPTGIKMSISRKKELLNFALNTNSFIIEDDFDAEFRINSAPTTSLWMLNNDNVIFFSTFSTTMFPGLRISYVIIPDSLVTKYNQKYNNYSTSVSTLTQACLAKFIENGYYASHINKLKRNYLKKRNLCIEILKPYSKLISYDAYSNYLSLLIKINKEIDEMDLISRLKKKKILIQSLQMLDVYKHQNNTLILGYTAIGLKDIPIALNILINEILNYEK